MMVAILRDLLWVLQFLCTPLELESVSTFEERMVAEGKTEEDKEDEASKVFASIMASMEQKSPIPSFLSKLLLQKIDDSFIRHVSKKFGYFGSEKGTEAYREYEKCIAAYVEEVEKEFGEKMASFLNDANTPDIQLINKCLVNKWQWLQKGTFSGFHWATATRPPLLTKSVIHYFDGIIKGIAPGFEEVR